MSDDISHIAKEALKTGELSKENISELAKLTAKQIYSQGYQAGEAANAIDVWNAAIEEAAKVIDKLNSEGPYQSITGATKIRKLKK